jgi:paraquat-inducible protein A
VLECGVCGARAADRVLRKGEMLRCRTCLGILKRYAGPSFQPAGAFAFIGLMLVLLANSYPIMSFNVAGNKQDNEIITGIRVLVEQGYWPLAILVFFCGMFAPAVYFAAVAYVSLACSRGGLPGAHKALGVARRVEPWSLVPVFAVACVVASVKLNLIGHADWQPGIWWITLLSACTLALGAVFDDDAAEQKLEAAARP